MACSKRRHRLRRDEPRRPGREQWTAHGSLLQSYLKSFQGPRGVPRRGEPMSPEELPAREAMEFDVVIVGAGPAGLAAAIRLRQLSPETSVVVVEKGSEVGAHILSGAVIDPIALDRLLPDWRKEDA